MWEPADSALARGRANGAIVYDQSSGKRDCRSRIGNITRSRGSGDSIPPELLILNRFGIGYPYIKAAWRMSLEHGLDGREVLLRAGVISNELWARSSALLEQERRERLRNAIFRDRLLDHAVNNLHRTKPAYSAHITFWNWQLAALCLFIFVSVISVFTGIDNLLVAILVLGCAFYTAVVFLRAQLLAWYDRRVRSEPEARLVSLPELPVYSLLVPLYRESNQIGDLTSQLSSINWPLDKLDIKLICERDDRETIAAIHDAKLPDYFDLVIVPKAEPRTKPKALNYALPLCRGEFVVIYDAEDRPSPNQLREAFSRFATSDPELACLQAPLIISNTRQNWLTRMFFIEYLTLFKGILPVLARWKVPIPLGGTSNHFRKSALISVGAWDPYNVTEDADLGIRLSREGYKCSTLELPTFEEAPPRLVPWIMQRTRWMKGWMQTILVHNRSPLELFRSLGTRNAIAFHLLLTSIVISALVHPLFLALAIVELNGLGTGLQLHGWFTGYGIFNLVAGYTTYLLLVHLVLKSHGQKGQILFLLTLPAYWLLISIAAWRALLHLIVKPHRWEKTPHGLADVADYTYIGTKTNVGKTP